MSDAVTIRAATRADVPKLAAIYNHYVVHSHATFDVELVSLEARFEWFAHFSLSGPYRLLVADHAGEILGYATSSAFHPKQVYERSIEVGIYVTSNSFRHGVGTMLYEELFSSLSMEPSVERLVAGVTLPNDASVALHLKFGFKPVGTFRRVSHRNGNFLDLCWLDRPARLAV